MKNEVVHLYVSTTGHLGHLVNDGKNIRVYVRRSDGEHRDDGEERSYYISENDWKLKVIINWAFDKGISRNHHYDLLPSSHALGWSLFRIRWEEKVT